MVPTAIKASPADSVAKALSSTVPTPSPRPIGPARASGGMLAFAFLLFLIEAIALQYAFGAYAMDFSALTSDEAAHFVTSVMVREYLTSGDWQHPFAFASNYYVHYPKVAIGHWPPGFYALLSVWMLAAGSSRAAALVCMAGIAAGLAVVTFAAARALVAPWAGWFTGGLLLALPMVRQSTGQVVYEHATTLLLLLAALQFARGMRTDRLRDWLAFGLLSSAAILTNGSGWALGLVPPLALVLGRRLDLLTSPRMWASAAIVLASAVPWYVATQSIRTEENAFVGGGLDFVRSAVVLFPSALVGSLGAGLTVCAAVGLWAAFVRRDGAGITPAWACLAALAVAKLALHIAVPAGLEPRYVLSALPCMLLFAALGVDRLAHAVGAATSAVARPVLAAVAVAPIATAIIAGDPSTAGYTAAALGVAESRGAMPQAQVVVSDSQGEGAWIAAMASVEPRPSSVVLRGSKLFVVEDWLGRDAVERYDSPGEVHALLDTIPVSAVVIDTTTAAGEVRGYHALVAAAVASSPEWERAGSFAVTRHGRPEPEGLQLYRRRTPPAVPPDLERITALALRGSLRD